MLIIFVSYCLNTHYASLFSNRFYILVYLGEDMTSYLEKFKGSSCDEYVPGVKDLNIGVKDASEFEVPSEDRNRTSPFPYGGARFEFRAVGSSQNVSMVNTVLSTITAKKFCEFADRADAGDDIVNVAKESLEKHWKVIFNGNGYDEANQDMLTEKGLWRIDSGVEAIKRLSDEKNIALFEEMKVMSKDETLARETVFHDHYTGTVEMEASSMIDMINQHIIPSVKKAGVELLEDLESAVDIIKEALHIIHDASSSYEKAGLARKLRLETMVDVRKICDSAEEMIPSDLWTLATYKELLFLDSHLGPP